MNFEYIGPVQMLMVGFGPDADYRGAILEELDALTLRGLIRVIDLQFMLKTEEGELLALESSDLTDDEAIQFGAVIGSLIGMGEGGTAGSEAGAIAGAQAVAERGFGMTVGDIVEIAAQLQPGTAVGMLLLEHVWAAKLKYALRSTGGVPIAQGLLTPEALFMVGREVQAVVEAEAAIEIADAVKGAAMLDALTTLQAVEEVKAAAAAQALQALIVADLIEDYAAQQALDALVAAGLISDLALAEAERTALSAEQEAQEALSAINAVVDQARD